MARTTRDVPTIDISTPEAHLKLSDEGDSQLSFALEGVSLTGWSDPRAWWREAIGQGTPVDFTANIVGDEIVVDIDPTMKSGMKSTGHWVVDILDPTSRRLLWATGTVDLHQDVGRP